MTTAPRVTTADLELAALWLDNYEAQDDDPSGEGMRRVAAWLRQHADRRRVDARWWTSSSSSACWMKWPRPGPSSG
jgi:hypothetical protein